MRTRAVRPDKLDYEYEMNISKAHDSVLEKDYILFEIRTKKIFENFAYRINVIPKIELIEKLKQHRDFNFKVSVFLIDLLLGGTKVEEYEYLRLLLLASVILYLTVLFFFVFLYLLQKLGI